MKSTPFKGDACSTGASTSPERKLKIQEHDTGSKVGAEIAHIQIVQLNTHELGDFGSRNRGYSHG